MLTFKSRLLSSVPLGWRPLGATALGQEAKPHSYAVTFHDPLMVLRLTSAQLQPTEAGMIAAAARRACRRWLAVHAP